METEIAAKSGASNDDTNVLIVSTNARDYASEALDILQRKDKFCFEGGGILGYAYAGAMIRLRELGGLSQPLTHTVGSSVGSIASIALAAGASPEYIRSKILSMNLQRFKDGGNIFQRAWRFLFRYGSHKGDEVENFLGEILHDLVGDADVNFVQLFERTGVHLTVPYVSTRYKKTQYANHETEPTLMVRQAARWSSTIPLFFQASRRSAKATGCFGGCCWRLALEDLLVDGGTTDNYPIHRLRDLDRRRVIGFKLVNSDSRRRDHNGQRGSVTSDAEGSVTSDAEGSVTDAKGSITSDAEGSRQTIAEESVAAVDHGIPKNIVEYAFRLVEILREQALRFHVDEDDWKLTCKIDVGQFTTTDFDISEDDKQWLYDQGVAAVDRHLEEIETMLRAGTYV